MKLPVSSLAGELVQGVDPRSAWLVVAFPLGGRSPSLPLAISLASGADKLVSVPGFCVAHFSPVPGAAGRAAALLSVVSGWRGVFAVFGGAPVPPGPSSLVNLAAVLSCFAAADGAVGSCSALVPSVYREPGDDVAALVPCRFLLRVFPAPLSRLDPADPVSQVAALARVVGCAACPAFHAGDYRTIFPAR